jgi:peptidyl-dipeptidase A
MQGAEVRMQRYLEEFHRRAEPLYREMSHAFWRASISGRKEDEIAAADAETRFRSLYNAPEDLERLKRELESGIEDPTVRRQALLLIHGFTANTMAPALLEETVRRQQAIETTFHTFRARTGDRSYTANEIAQVLKKSVDPAERRAVWEAAKEIGSETAGPLLELVGIRNRIARDRGFPDYYRMGLELQELTAEQLISICEDFERLSNAPFRLLREEMDSALARTFHLSPEDLRPWHYSDPFFQEAPATGTVDLDPLFANRDLEEIAVAFYDGIGLPIADLLRRSDLYEKEGKDQHAFCIDMDRAGDIRILCNLRPTARWMGTLLHECGHAAYDRFLDPDLPFTLRAPAHTFTTEAIANLMGRQEREAAWLKAMVEVPAGLAASLEDEAPALLRAQMLVTTRWMLVMIHFERELYADPSQDLNRLWWDLVEKYQFLRRPEGRDRPDWASKIHLACYPIYYHNYLLGEFMASQVRACLEREVLARGPESGPGVTADKGGIRAGGATMAGHPEVGRFLREKIFAPGKTYRWDDLLRRATGESLNPAHFVRQFI